MVEKAKKTVRRTTEIVTFPGESMHDAIARCLPGAVNPCVVGGFPVGSSWENRRGLVIEHDRQER